MIENQGNNVQMNKPMNFFMKTSLLYYLSCCLLLLGTYMMMRSTVLSTSFIVKYYQTYALYWIYEIVLITFCVFILRKLKLRQDGLVLASLGVLLLMDPTFFNNVFYSYNLNIGLSVNAVCLSLAVASLAALVFIGGVPHHKGSLILAFGTVLFVYSYPILLNLNLASNVWKNNIFYMLWWLPFILLTLVWQDDFSFPSINSDISLHERENSYYISWQLLIGLFILISHLVESNVGYGFTFYAIYLSPLILVVTLAVYSLAPEFHYTLNGKQLIWIAAILSIFFAVFQDDIFKHVLGLGLSLSPLRITLIAEAIVFLLFWKKYGQIRYLMAFLLCPFFMLLGLKFWPFIYLSLVFSTLAVVRKHWLYALIAGLAFFGLMMFILPSSYDKIKPLIYIQGSGLWAGFVFWLFDLKDKNTLLTALAALLLFTALIFGYKYYFLGLSVVVAVLGILLKLKIMKYFAAFSLAGGLIWVFHNFFIIVKQKMSFVFGSGLVTIILSFILLFLGFYFSILKTRRERDTKVEDQ